MQVGTITIGGTIVGVVVQSMDGHVDTDAPMVPDASLPFGNEDEEHVLGHHHGGRGTGYRGHGHGPGHHHHDTGTSHGSEAGPRGQGNTSRDLDGIPYSPDGNPFDRSRFRRELEAKPWLRDKLAHISLGENQDPRANTAVLETMMNRAVVRGTSLEAQARRHRSSGVDEGGYYAGWASSFSDNKRQMFNRNLSEVLGEGGHGQSNVSNYATDNSSGDLAARERATGSFVHHATINRESFFSPGSAEPAFRDRWQRLHRQALDTEKTKIVDTKPFDPGTMAP